MVLASLLWTCHSDSFFETSLFEGPFTRSRMESSKGVILRYFETVLCILTFSRLGFINTFYIQYFEVPATDYWTLISYCAINTMASWHEGHRYMILCKHQAIKQALYKSICNNFEIVGELVVDFYQHFNICL